jgi:Ser/Thr protein kinase RdoA (MazF antagonist)
MLNMRTVCDHGRKRLAVLATPPNTRFEIPRVLPAEDGRNFWVDASGSFWRAMSFIEGSLSWDIVQNADHAHEVGAALGLFHTIMSDLPTEDLVDTLPGFHVTPRYLRRYDEVRSRTLRQESPGTVHAHRFISERRDCVQVLEEAREQGKLRKRPVHGDPKVGNVLIDASTRRAISLVDLDTVMPGLIHYDIGDCLRSCCNPRGSDVEERESVHFDLDLCRAALQGYLGWAGGSLTEHDVEYFYDAIRLIAFELGLRFLTDFMEGNVYFKTDRPDRNLSRALVQFRLTESIELQEREIRTVIRELR